MERDVEELGVEYFFKVDIYVVLLLPVLATPEMTR